MILLLTSYYIPIILLLKRLIAEKSQSSLLQYKQSLLTESGIKDFYINSRILEILEIFRSGSKDVSDRRQRIVLNGVTSDWASVLAGVPQGSILGPLLFLTSINDIVNGVTSSIRLFAGDISSGSFRPRVVSAQGCFGLGRFGPGSLANFGGSFRPDFFKSP